jgi:hypothetical protein
MPPVHKLIAEASAEVDLSHATAREKRRVHDILENLHHMTASINEDEDEDEEDMLINGGYDPEMINGEYPGLWEAPVQPRLASLRQMRHVRPRSPVQHVGREDERTKSARKEWKLHSAGKYVQRNGVAKRARAKQFE